MGCYYGQVEWWGVAGGNGQVWLAHGKGLAKARGTVQDRNCMGQQRQLKLLEQVGLSSGHGGRES